MEEDDASSRGEGVDDSVDVRVALDPQLPQLALKVANQWLSRQDIALYQQLNGSPQSSLGPDIKALEKRPNRVATVGIDIEDNRPRRVLHSGSSAYAFQYTVRLRNLARSSRFR